MAEKTAPPPLPPGGGGVGGEGEQSSDLAVLAVLAPDGEITIGGEKITVKKLTFGDQIKHAMALKWVSDALKTSFSEDVGCLIDALSDIGDALYELLEAATGKPRDWIEGLQGGEGEALLLTFWTVNADFFVRRLVAYPALAARASAGAASSPPSSATATASPT
ncbi:MAG: hypothetical protein LBE62_02270 [Azonexus sp.]|jgi:hypothetical protein|nr:hypothetical protein [Azonexus sp.]